MLPITRPYGRICSFDRAIHIAAALMLAACASGGIGLAPEPVVSHPSHVGGAPVGGGDIAATTASTPAQITEVGIAGRTYFVAPYGDDAAPGVTPDTPFRTLERALSLVAPGDTIELRAGVYVPLNNGFPFDRAGAADARIKIKSYNGEHAVLDAAGKQFAVLIPEQSPYWIIEGLELRGGTAYTVKIESHHVHLIGNNIHGSSNDLIKLVQTSDDVIIYGNEIHHNNAPPGANAQGIDIVGGDRTWIAHNYVHHTASIAIYAKGNARNTIIENNRVEGIPGRGIMLGQSTGVEFMWDGDYESYDGVIRDNVIVDTDDACLATASSFNVKILHNSCLNAARASHGAIFVSNESEKGQAGTNIEIMNNIVVSAGRPVVKIGPNAVTDPRTLHIDRNLYFSPGVVSFLWEDAGVAGDINAWRATTGQDATSNIADPLYADGSLALRADSPAIDAAIVTDLVRHDYNRAARPQGASADIGAFESR